MGTTTNLLVWLPYEIVYGNILAQSLYGFSNYIYQCQQPWFSAWPLVMGPFQAPLRAMVSLFYLSYWPDSIPSMQYWGLSLSLLFLYCNAVRWWHPQTEKSWNQKSDPETLYPSIPLGVLRSLLKKAAHSGLWNFYRTTPGTDVLQVGQQNKSRAFCNQYARNMF